MLKVPVLLSCFKVSRSFCETAGIVDRVFREFSATPDFKSEIRYAVIHGASLDIDRHE